MLTEQSPKVVLLGGKLDRIYVGTFPVPDERGRRDVAPWLSPGVKVEDRTGIAAELDDAIFFQPVQFVGVPMNARGVGGRGGADRKGVLTYRSLGPGSTFAWFRTVPAESAGPVTGGRDVAKADLTCFVLFSMIVLFDW